MKEKAIEIIKTLQDKGHYALLVGGCVRDQIMGKQPKDYDIVTSCLPEEVQAIFKDTIPVGEKFGVTIVHKDFEVAVFRVDQYNPNSFEVALLDPNKHTLEELVEKDSSRRDLSMNSIYYDPIADKYYDPQNGIQDIKEGRIAFVGNALERVKEDPIRLLRFYRFAGRYPHMDHHWEDWDVLEGAGVLLKKVSMERIFQELTKILLEFPTVRYGDFKQLCSELYDILPELTALMDCEQNPIWHPEGNVLRHTYQALTHLRIRTPETVWAMLLHDIGKPKTFKIRDGKITNYGHEHVGAEMTEDILRRLKCSNKFIDEVVYLVKNHMRTRTAPKMRKGKVIEMIKHPYYRHQKEISACDSMGCIGDIEWYHWLTDFENSDKFPKGEVIPLINGQDLIDKGMKPGPEFKDIIKQARLIQLENPNMEKEEIIKLVLDK